MSPAGRSRVIVPRPLSRCRRRRSVCSQHARGASGEIPRATTRLTASTAAIDRPPRPTRCAGARVVSRSQDTSASVAQTLRIGDASCSVAAPALIECERGRSNQQETREGLRRPSKPSSCLTVSPNSPSVNNSAALLVSRAKLANPRGYTIFSTAPANVSGMDVTIIGGQFSSRRPCGQKGAVAPSQGCSPDIRRVVSIGGRVDVGPRSNRATRPV
jgi:hypothetical protein